uniref:Uncharacterized protein n=1 Tax=Saimiri boliviensis boliviensis TaxID=39432 RepID=A0A2K6SMZ2_SAIBB
LKVVGNYRANAAPSYTEFLFICQLSLFSQHFVAYRNGRVDAAVSLGFLLCWRGGDLTNFKGYTPTSVIQRLHHQRESQIITCPIPFMYPIFFQVSEKSISGRFTLT